MRRHYQPALAVAAAAVVFTGAVLFAAQQTPPPTSSGAPAPEATAAARPATQTTAAAAEPVDYNWDVRPILSDNCFRCHGNDEKGRMGGLRLDQAESAYARRPGERERFAIVPGNPDASEMIRRITAPNPATRMPPAATN